MRSVRSLFVLAGLVAVSATFVLAAPAAAIQILTPTAVDASSTWPGCCVPAIQTINADDTSGWTAKPDLEDPSTWQASNSSSHVWHTDTGLVAGETITWELDSGAGVSIDAMWIWNENQLCCASGRSVQQYDLDVSFDGGSTFLANVVTDGILTQALALPTLTPDYVPFAEQTGATHVRLTIDSNYGDPNYVGLSEVRFSVVPEPSTAVLVGLGLLGLRARARAV